MIAPAAARAVLDRFRAGTEDLDTWDRGALLVVEVASGGAPVEVDVPTAFPAVVVAISVDTAPPLSPGGPDVALTSTPGAPRPWVVVDDPAGAVTQMRQRVQANPRAAAALVQVLRAGRGRPVEEGLVFESMAYSMLQSGPEFARWRAGRDPARHRSEPERAVLAERTGDVLTLTLNRPHVHNAYNARMRDELCEGLAVALADPQCRVVLRGAGPSFCSGGDLEEFGTAPDPVSAHMVRTGRSPARLLGEVSERVEARLHGSCAGSGIELPAFARTVTAAPGTRIWLPELAMGLIPGAGGTVSLAQRMGPGRTAWLALTGLPVDERTALEWGLVDGLSGEGQ